MSKNIINKCHPLLFKVSESREFVFKVVPLYFPQYSPYYRSGMALDVPIR